MASTVVGTLTADEIVQWNNFMTFQQSHITEGLAFTDDFSGDFWAMNPFIGRGVFPLGVGYTYDYKIFHNSPLTAILTAESAVDDSRGIWRGVQMSSSGDAADAPKNFSSSTPDTPDNDSLYDGVVYDACDIPVYRIRSGMDRKQASLYEVGFNTDPICIRDMKYRRNAAEEIAACLENFMDIRDQVWEWWNCDSYMAGTRTVPLIPNYMSVFHNLSVGQSVTNMHLMNPGVLTYGALDRYFSYGARAARRFNPFNSFGGSTKLSILTDPETVEYLLKEDSATREDLRYADPGMLLQGMPVQEVYRNYIFMTTLFPPRYVADTTRATGLRRVMPWLETNAYKNKKYILNPEYEAAPYQAAIVMMSGVMTNLVVPATPPLGSQTSWLPEMTGGEVSWRNVRDNDKNKNGWKGEYQMFLATGVEYGSNEHAITIIHKRAQYGTEYQLKPSDCSTTTACGVTVTSNIDSATQVFASTPTRAAIVDASHGLSVSNVVLVTFVSGWQINGYVQASADSNNFVVEFGTATDPVTVDIADQGGIKNITAV